jgi:geranylgeranyl pyrophosphate synthase
MVGNDNLSHHDIECLQQVVVDTGARDAMEQRINSLVEQAITALSTTELDAETHSALTALAHAVTQRNV